MRQFEFEESNQFLHPPCHTFSFLTLFPQTFPSSSLLSPQVPTTPFPPSYSTFPFPTPPPFPIITHLFKVVERLENCVGVETGLKRT